MERAAVRRIARESRRARRRDVPKLAPARLGGRLAPPPRSTDPPRAPRPAGPPAEARVAPVAVGKRRIEPAGSVRPRTMTASAAAAPGPPRTPPCSAGSAVCRGLTSGVAKAAAIGYEGVCALAFAFQRKLQYFLTT